MTEISGWGSADARRIYGSEAKRFRPKLKKEDKLVMFVEELMR